MAIPDGFWTVRLEATKDRMNQNLIQFDTAANRPASATKGLLYIATDTGVLSYDNGSAWVTIATGLANIVEDTTPQLGGDLDSQNNAINNVGASGNDWGATAISFGPTVTVFTASGGGGPEIFFKEGTGSGAAANMQYRLNYNPSTNYFSLRSYDSDGSSTDADVFRVLDGQLSIDGNTTWDDNVFDDYDDALALSPYRDGVRNLAARKQDLIKMGVLREYEDGFVGYNDQRMAALLAGGIYQNRNLIDGKFRELETLISELKSEIAALKSQ